MLRTLKIKVTEKKTKSLDDKQTPVNCQIMIENDYFEHGFPMLYEQMFSVHFSCRTPQTHLFLTGNNPLRNKKLVYH